MTEGEKWNEYFLFFGLPGNGVYEKQCTVTQLVKNNIGRVVYNLNSILGIPNGSALLLGGLRGMEYPQ